MSRAVEYLISKKNMTLKNFALQNDIPPTTLYTVLKRGCTNSSVSVVLKICKGLGITFSDLAKFADSEDFSDNSIVYSSDSDSNSPSNTDRPEYKYLLKATSNLPKKAIISLAESIDNASEEDIELITSLLQRFTKSKADKYNL